VHEEPAAAKSAQTATFGKSRKSVDQQYNYSFKKSPVKKSKNSVHVDNDEQPIRRCTYGAVGAKHPVRISPAKETSPAKNQRISYAQYPNNFPSPSHKQKKGKQQSVSPVKA
jgi:hypothetical protein